MTTITQAELDTMLAKESNRDMGIARRKGAICITGTKIGNIEVVILAFAQAKAELPGASLSEIAQRAQSIKLRIAAQETTGHAL
jgi:hypothetical protein